MKHLYNLLKRKHEQKNIQDMTKCFFHIQYADNIIRMIHSILDKETIEEYEIYRDSVKKIVIKDIDYWIEGSFNYHPFFVHT